MSYTKLFSTLVRSSLWITGDDRVRIVWITMLALRDYNHIVAGPLIGLADAAKVPVEDAERAIKLFLAPDPNSRNRDHEGRRIEVVPNVGWRLLNGEYYRQLERSGERTDYYRDYKRKQRAKIKKGAGTLAERVYVKRVEEGEAA